MFHEVVAQLATVAMQAAQAVPGIETVRMVALPERLVYALAAAGVIGPTSAILWTMKRQARQLDKVMADDRRARDEAREDEKESRRQRDQFIREQMTELRAVSANNATTTGILQAFANRMGTVEVTLGSAANGSMAQHAATQTLLSELRTDIAEALGKPLPQRTGRSNLPTIFGLAVLSGAGSIAGASGIGEQRSASVQEHNEHSELYTPALFALAAAYPRFPQ